MDFSLVFVFYKGEVLVFHSPGIPAPSVPVPEAPNRSTELCLKYCATGALSGDSHGLSVLDQAILPDIHHITGIRRFCRPGKSAGSFGPPAVAATTKIHAV